MAKILIPLNQSELSQKVLPSVEKLFPPGDNQLILFYITNPPGNVGFGEPDLSAGYVPRPGDQSVKPATLHPIYASQQEDSIRAHVHAELSPLTQRLEAAGYKVKVRVGFDKDPVAAIASLHVNHSFDLIAMSTVGRVGVTRFFFRHIADTLAQQEQLPVMLVHPPTD